MNARSAVALLLALGAGAVSASAQQAQSPRPAQEECVDGAPQPQGRPAPASKPAPAARAPRRRSVQQVIATVPPPAAAPSYGPVLTPVAPAPAGVPPVYPPPPAQVGTCSGGQCMDAAGNTYNTGIGNSGVDSRGRLCTRTGTTVQCF